MKYFQWLPSGLLSLGLFFSWQTFARAEQVVFSEIMYHPSGALPEYVEVYNQTATPLDMADWRLRGGVDYDFPAFSAGDPGAAFLGPFERILLAGVDPAVLRAAYNIPGTVRVFGPWRGNLDNAGERITLEDKNGVGLCTVEYNDRGKWPVAADGAGHSLVLVDGDRRIDDWRNWRASARRGGTPGVEPVGEPETPVANPEINLAQGIPFVDYGDVWKFHDQNQDLGTAWRGVGYSDAGWAQGPGLFGFESSALPAPGIQTPLADFNQLTYYLRRSFVYNGSLQGVTISIDQIVDDGAVYYLNGQELGRVGVGGGTVGFGTAASRTVGNATEEHNVITVSGSALVNGANLLAVEVHQVNTTSSDVVFGCRLKISVPNQETVVINEVLPGPAGAGFVEFYNPTAAAINLRNHHLSDDPARLTHFRISTDLVVPARGFASVGFAESGLSAGSALTVYLTAADGVTAMNAISSGAVLGGRSLGRKPAGGGSWFLFNDPTRDGANESQGSVAAALRLSEIHFSASNTVDWVEFYNAGGGSLMLDGLYLASDREMGDRVALAGAVAPGEYASRDCAFPVRDGELRLFLVNAANTVLAARIFARSDLGDSLQAFPAGVDEWYAAAASSRDEPNDPARQEDVVINEIMYDPPSDEVAGEYIELFNRGPAPVDVSDWRFSDGIDFRLPPGTIIPASGFLVVAADADWMRRTYGAIAVVGNFGGRLRNTGDLVRLEDQWGNLVDAVDYQPGGNWPGLANGGGSSIELRNPWLDNALASAWADSNETNTAAFRTYRYADVFRQLRADGAATDYKELHFHLVGDSHVVLRQIQLRANGSGSNLIQNGDRMSADCCSASGWLAQGTHHASRMQNGELHILADGHGDNRPNRVEIDATGMQSGVSYEVSFEGRWVAGSPRLVVQTWDHSIATSLALEIPANLGTPGTLNSQFVAAPPPLVDELQHRPPVPAPGEVVTVRARINSVTAGPQVRLHHRLDNNNGNGVWNSKAMFDDGLSGGDAVAGDGIYSAQLTEYGGSGEVVQFYVRATAGGEFSQAPKWGGDRPAMYVVDTPSAGGNLRRMRLVVSAFDLRALSDQDNPTGAYGYKFPRLSNHYYNMTLIINEREVVYNCEARTSGSPWTRGGSLSRGKFKLPKDRLFRGKEKLMFDNDASGGSRHHNRISRYWLYLLGHPANENEYIQVEVNNGGASLREETEPLGNDLLERNYPNGSQGELYRIDDEWWFQDSWSRSQRDADWMYKGTDNAGRYRTEWMKRSREDEDDFSALTGFFKKLSQGYTQAEIERLIDPDLTMKMCAVRGYIYDWDSFSLNRGKNGYFYRKPTDGRFMFWHWDSDLAFQDVNNIFYSGRAGFPGYFQKSYNFRLFKHYLARLVEEYARNSARMSAWLQAEEAASSEYTVSGTYVSWFGGREGPAYNVLGASRSVAFNIATGSGGTINTSAGTLNLSGVAPLRVYRVEVVGHPEAVFRWTSETGWTLTGVRLRAGLETLTVNAVDEFGQVFHTGTVTVNKAGNALPVARLEADPASWRVSVIDPLELDARGSTDPDGGPLTFAWSVAPVGAQLDASEQDRATCIFPRPAWYTISLTATDAEGGSDTVQREVAVYAPGGFSPFNDPVLEPHWETTDVRQRANSSVGAYYSLSEADGWLVVQVLDDAARPLGTVTPRYPFIARALPAQTDWGLLTKVRITGQVFGDYLAGLLVETQEGGVNYRYAFGIQSGGLLSVRRVAATGAATTLRSTPVSENEAVIRIRRAGDALHFERLLDGSWVAVHSSGLTGGALAVRGGMCLATESAQIIRAAFDYVVLVDPSATSDLREQLRISEIMYNPEGGAAFEYVELVNIGETALDLSGVQFTAGIDYTFGSVVLAPGRHVVVAADPIAFETRYGGASLYLAPGNFTGRLDNSGETLELSDAQGAVLLSVTYGTAAPWPTAADGEGSSLEAIDPAGNLNDAANWRASPEPNGSPGRLGGALLGTVVLNEVLTHTDPPWEDAIELFNRTPDAIDIGGWFLSDSRDEPKRFRIPDGTVIAGGGFAVFYELDFQTNNPLVPFALSSVHGDQVYLSAADAAGNLTGYQSRVDFGPAENGVSLGRYETSQGSDFTALEARTFGRDAPATSAEFRTGTGGTNAAARVGPVVINEILYHPPDIGGTNDNTADEFIELHNLEGQAVPLFDPAFPTNTWRLRGGVDFDFPAGATLGARGFMVLVSFDPGTNAAALVAFRVTHGLAGTVPIHGPYAGKLQNRGEWVRLLRPDAPEAAGPDAGVVPYVLVDAVHYGDSEPWPESADGAGDSLQRRRPFEYGNDPVNWKGAAPTVGRANVAGSTFTDADADGLPDDYEAAHGFSAADPSDAAQDADGDGRSNEEEYHEGTDPRSAAEVWRAPQIVVEPGDRELSAGAPVTFTVSATGTAPLHYQWRKNGLALLGATNASLSLTNVQLADAAEYHAVVVNAAGFARSGFARLTVNQPLAILAQPLGRYADVGSAATLSVVAVGTGPLRYQWRLEAVAIPGATEASLVLENLQPDDSGNYDVVVSDELTAVTSASATLIVLSPPRVVTQPQSQTAVAYSTVYFNVVAGGEGPFRYQWRFNGVNLAGATNAYLYLPNVQPGQAGVYTVQVLNPVSSVLSSNALLTLLIPAAITEQPATQMVDPGASVTFRVRATSTTPITYQWRFNDQDIPGATGSTLTLFDVQDPASGSYQVIVTDDVGSVASEVAMLTVLSAPVIVRPPLNLTVVEGGTAVFSVETTGALPMGYRWRFNYRNLTAGEFWSHQDYLTVTNATTESAGVYQVIITNITTGLPGLAKHVSVNLTVLPDRDRDGQPDAWELAHGFDPDDPADGASDADGDALANRDEYEAGTDPADPGSYLRVEALETGGSAHLTFPAVSNRTYTVEYSDGLHPPGWFKLEDLVAHATNRVETVPDRGWTTQRYYRLVTPRQPDAD